MKVIRKSDGKVRTFTDEQWNNLVETNNAGGYRIAKAATVYERMAERVKSKTAPKEQETAIAEEETPDQNGE